MLVESSYKPPPFCKNRHLQTIYPAFFRKIDGVIYERDRLILPDGDFIDLDWSKCEGSRLVVLLHGLEGNASRHYIKGMARAFNARGWDAVAVNFRGCSEEPNRLPRSYHAGATEDLEAVLRHVEKKERYEEIGLIGFSLGGNMTLKYMGERGADVPSALKGVVVFSVPCDLASSSEAIARPENRPYMKNFLKNLRAKMTAKAELFPDVIKLGGYDRIKDFKQFDDAYTAPLHGFADAEAYWKACSCCAFLHDVRVPALLVNAKDDPFLGKACYPLEIARSHKHLSLEMPDYGGHVGFIRFNRVGLYWSEQRALKFLAQ